MRHFLRRHLLRRPRQPGLLAPQEGYDRWSADYGDEPNALQQLEADALARLYPDVDGLDVLDIGCGKARAASHALGCGARRATAADLSLGMLVSIGAEATRVACDVTRLPFQPASFDVVVCALVLGHVKDLGAALDSFAAVLRPGGYLLISDFHPYATLRGWQRTFIDPSSGATYAIEQHLHLFSEYVQGFKQRGLVLEALEEPLWQDSPVAFVLRARKQ